MKKIKLLPLLVIIFLFEQPLHAQCTPGSCGEGLLCVQVKVNTDAYTFLDPTGYSVKVNGTVVASGTAITPVNTVGVVLWSGCLPEGANVSLTLTDGYGDGIEGMNDNYIVVNGNVVSTADFTGPGPSSNSLTVVRQPGSTIVNTYTPVISFSSCFNKITVEDASTFTADDTVLLIQMKGAVTDSSNTASFGTISSYNNAGNYEFNYVKSKEGNVIELKNELTRQYDLPDGKVQLIRVPYFDNINLSDTITCLPWDGSKGGVVVLNAKDTIQLNQNIDVSGKGFRGGSDPYSNPSFFYCYENQYYYSANPDYASGKGEGIAILSTGKSFGKGACANGGGGGNSHNSGGGGGSNAVSGGMGGYNFDGSPCNTIVPFDNRGIGGKPLIYNNSENRIFLGGGGGAGHSNNPQAFQSKGGNGGGIIIMIANNLKMNSKKIIADGQQGAPCGLTSSGCHEGMGGGGGAGTVLLNIKKFLDSTIIETTGGKGADMTATPFGRVGPGGGGSGGAVWFNKTSIPAKVSSVNTGGAGGVCTGYSNDPWGTTAGQNGLNLFSLNIPFDTTLFVDTCLIPVTITSFNTKVIDNAKVKLFWHTEEETNISSYTIQRSEKINDKFVSIGTVKANINSGRNDYVFNDMNVSPDIIYYYRLRINENSGYADFSETHSAKIAKNNIDIFVYPNPTEGVVNVELNELIANTSVKLINNLGQIVFTEDINSVGKNKFSIDIRNQPSGTYLLILQNDFGKMIKKLIKY